ncbi:hypothetical protein EV121DRAFT_197536, partial [Schizophyllum commune]
ISRHLYDLCYTGGLAHRKVLLRVYERVLLPCLATRTHCVSDTWGSVHPVHSQYHDNADLHITDYFSGLGYLLAHQESRPHDLVELIQLLSIYSQLCRTSARFLNVNPPTVVQLLWETKPRPVHAHHLSCTTLGRFSLASSVAPGKGDGREEVRAERVRILGRVWPPVFDSPTPVQKAHAEAGVCYAFPSEELFGTPWGHCGESVTFASMYKSMQSRVPLGTLALSVKTMTSSMPGVGVTPAETIMKLHRLQDIVEVLRVSGALRPMCLNCQHLSDSVGARLEDYACLFASQRSTLTLDRQAI